MARFSICCFVAVTAFLCIVTPAQTETVTIYRDEYGIPHIYADTAEAGLYGQGWTMAEDALARTLENFLRGLGRYSEAFGPGENDENVRADLESLMWDHLGTAKRHYDKLPEAFRRHNAAFVMGLNDYMREHPDEVPDWWVHGDVTVYMPVAFSRQFIWSWPAGQAAGDLRRIGLRPSYDVTFPYSNEVAIAPKRTKFGAAALIIDPHLGWFGRTRYWEVRIHAGDVHISGFATAGFPYVNLGHNNHVAWAHTTGGPDTADVYELKLNPEYPTQYLFDGMYRDLTTRTVSLHPKGEDAPRKHVFYYSHHGPIIAKDGNKAYAAALAYEQEIGYLESKYLFMIARDYKDVIKALEVRQIMPQNVMVADTKGNIYYQRTGRVPIRPQGYDFSRPVDGSTSKTEWLGLHPTKDLVQVLNPPQGYMQNCNITPDVMMVGSPMKPDKYPEYIFNQPAMYTHQRATRMTEMLHNNDSVSIDDFKAMALDKHCYQYERWTQELVEADRKRDSEASDDYHRGFRAIRRWNGEVARNSAGALKYYYWRTALNRELGDDAMDALRDKIDHYLDLFGVERESEPVTDAEHAAMVAALEQGMADMRRIHGTLDLEFGDVFRVGRTDYDGDSVSWPVGGGSLRAAGMATPRAIGFTSMREDNTRWGRSGQTSTEVVILSNPIRSFTQPPVGQSDHPDSPHFRDQAEKLFSESEFKPAWFHKDELLDGHMESSYTLQYEPTTD